MPTTGVREMREEATGREETERFFASVLGVQYTEKFTTDQGNTPC
jgi:hypothetical protein